MLTLNSNYSRIKSIIYEEGEPIIELFDYFPDLEKLTEPGILYLNKFMSMYPERFRILKQTTEMEPKIIMLYYDVETTGIDFRKNGIHQLSGLIEIDGVVKEEFNWYVQPNPKAVIDPAALSVSGTSEDDFEMYPTMQEVFKEFKALLDKYINRFDNREKAWLTGFRNSGFDDDFLRAWFTQNGDPFFGSYFWSSSIDVSVLASQYLKSERHLMPSFKLKRVAMQLGIAVDESRLHDSKYDVYLTRGIYYIVTETECLD